MLLILTEICVGVVFVGWCRHKASGKFEAHLWDKHARNPTTKKTGRQGEVFVYFGNISLVTLIL
jgi:hypothetical protein